MTPRKKKATFYLPEDLLRMARVHAARTDRRDSQVIEQALRAYLGYDADAGPWAGVIDQVADASSPPAGEEPDREAAQPDEPEGASPISPPRAEPAVPPPPLDAESALGLALTELHSLREEAGASRS